MQAVGHYGAISISRQERLGRGRTSVVFVGQFDYQTVAVKRIQKDDERIEREASFLRRLRHPNIVHYHFFDQDEDFDYIAMERCIYSLERYLHENHPFNELRLLKDLALGLQYLHDNGVIHRNIHTSNVLLVGSIGNVSAKLADFGIAKFSVDGSSISCSGQTGSRRYCNPEELRKEKVSKKSDIYALGLCYFTALFRKKSPFGEDDITIATCIRDGVEPDWNAANLGDNRLVFETTYVIDLLKPMLQGSKSDRPTIADVLSHFIFWKMERLIDFLQNVGDQMMNKGIYNQYISKLELAVTPTDWSGTLFEGMTKIQTDTFEAWFRKRCGKNFDVCDPSYLLIAIRHWSHHFGQLPNEVQLVFNHSKHDMMQFLQKKFPKLVPVVFQTFKSCTHKDMAHFYQPP